jgi:hypothetical protein
MVVVVVGVSAGVAFTVVVAVAVVASAGLAFESSDGIHIVPKIVLKDGTDASQPLKKRAGASSTP